MGRGEQPSSTTGDDEREAGQASFGSRAEPGSHRDRGHDGAQERSEPRGEPRYLGVTADVRLSRAQRVAQTGRPGRVTQARRIIRRGHEPSFWARSQATLSKSRAAWSRE